ncbi:HD-GYP domain-containing protein [Propionivibrio sp.]|uniref:HD-GYP domain-containing protein n=1 Tax=Propionivibrio sp. TaxID=2212460 RepID=UPI0025EC4572|nr:HD-GYP domain-containing protein [Propionivibrio sp.]
MIKTMPAAKKMPDPKEQFIDVADLRIGLFVFIDLGWISHPFPLNSFKIHSPEQIATIRTLGIDRIRYSPEKSDPEPVVVEEIKAPPAPVSPQEKERERRKLLLDEQNASLKVCERQYSQAAKSYKQLLEQLKAVPDKSFAQSQALVAGAIKQLQGLEETSIRLLSEQIGDRASLHSINVLVLSLLLGKACGLGEADLQDLGIGALLHDIGKQELPSRMRWDDEQFSSAEKKLYQEHVRHGIALGMKMELPNGALHCIAQHHEAANGNGYPKRLSGEQISPAARILTLTNQYDNLCNPGNPAAAQTPHEALSTIFTRLKGRFDAQTMSVFIRMMGVYPPGSAVQLTDDRYAMVVSVNSSRPLKPRLIIYNPHIPKAEALVVDLEQQANLGVKRSIKPMQLPRQALDYLSPRQHICYFFERASSLAGGEDTS